MANPILTTASFCSGVGWLDEGLRAGCNYFGVRAEPALLCEWDAYAAAVLLARMEDASMEPAPVWGGDMRDFDGHQFRGLVDIAVAGLPCQPYSPAGKHLGNEDQRSFGDGDGPLPQFLRIVGEMRPSLVFLENVPAWVCGGWFRPFGDELCGMGYAIEEPVFVTAESVGASHKRERVFILAHTLRRERKSWAGWQRVFNGGKAVGNSKGQRTHDQQPSGAGKGIQNPLRRSNELAEPTSGGLGELRQPPRGDGLVDGAVGDVDHAAQQQQQSGLRIGADAEHARPSEPSTDVANASGPRRKERRRSSSSSTRGGRPQATAERTSLQSLANAEPAERWREDARWGQEIGIALGGSGTRVFAPGPKCEQWGAIIADAPHLAPAIEPGLRLLADGLTYVVDDSRTNQLRCAGNGCVPLAAAVAFVELVRRVIRDEPSI